MAERTIKHGLFSYFAPVPGVGIDGQETTRLTEQMAFRGQTVDIPREYDIQRGEEFGAFYTEEELEKLRSPASPDTVENEEGEEVELADLEHEDLVSWLTATGMFDGESKPTVPEVVGAAEGNPDLARRLLAAENEASGNQPRDGVVKGLTAVVEAGNQ